MKYWHSLYSYFLKKSIINEYFSLPFGSQNPSILKEPPFNKAVLFLMFLHSAENPTFEALIPGNNRPHRRAYMI